MRIEEGKVLERWFGEIEVSHFSVILMVEKTNNYSLVVKNCQVSLINN